MEPITREEMFLSDIAGESNFELEPITRKEKLLKKIAETGGSGGGGGGVSSWNDLTDKPFGEETEGIVTVLDRTFLTFNKDNQYIATIDPVELIVGKSYEVIWNGIPYICEAIEADLSSMGYGVVPAIGNKYAIGGENTGEPFAIALINDGAVTMVMNLMYANYASIEITTAGETYTKIPAEFLPEGYPYEKEGKKYIYDGNFEGREILPLSSTQFLVKISDDCFDMTDLIGQKVGLVFYGMQGVFVIQKNNLVDISEQYGVKAYALVEQGLSNPLIVNVQENTTGGGLSITKGLYFFHSVLEDMDNMPFYTTHLVFNGTTKIDEKFLPSNTLYIDVERVAGAGGQTDRTVTEVLEAYYTGKNIVARAEGSSNLSELYQISEISNDCAYLLFFRVTDQGNIDNFYMSSSDHINYDTITLE